VPTATVVENETWALFKLVAEMVDEMEPKLSCKLLRFPLLSSRIQSPKGGIPLQDE
jgi:hypothetical protein